jgi:hypothetical protein
MRGYYNPWTAANRAETRDRVAELKRQLPALKARLRYYEGVYWDAIREGDVYALGDLKDIVFELRQAVELEKGELGFLNPLGK